MSGDCRDHAQLSFNPDCYRGLGQTLNDFDKINIRMISHALYIRGLNKMTNSMYKQIHFITNLQNIDDINIYGFKATGREDCFVQQTISSISLLSYLQKLVR